MIVVLSLLARLFSSPIGVHPHFWVECHQIGDNLYNCRGGSQ